jgi:hypothetical protein
VAGPAVPGHSQAMKTRCLMLAALFIVSVAVIGCIPWFTVLTLVDARQDSPARFIRVRDGQQFVLSYTHSVHKRPVYEYIQITGDQLTVVKSRFEAFGAGLPATAGEGPIRMMDGMVEVAGLNRQSPDITLFVGTVSEHRLHINSHVIFLADIVPPDNPLRIKIIRISALSVLLQCQALDWEVF